MKITDIRATTVAIPLDAPLRHANGGHWGRFVRTIIEVDTDEGLTGLGEMRGAGAATEDAFLALRHYLIGHDPFDLEQMRFMLLNPTAALYGNRTHLHAAMEFACLDLMGKYLGLPVSKLLGGPVRDRIEFGSYLFFRYANEEGNGEIETPEQLADYAGRMRDEHGFHTHKLKGGVFAPGHELECYNAVGERFPQDGLRYDPNSVLSVDESIRFAREIDDLNNDYLEDPTWGLNGMRQVRERTSIPMATNTVVVNFEQLATNVRDPAVDVILLDTVFWGGMRPCLKAAGVCETFQLSVAMHSSGELGIQLATMLHLGAVIPALPFAIDSHYHHLLDDVIVGGKMQYRDGALDVPTGPGLGVELDREKMERYADHFRKVGNYVYDRDPKRPGWFPLIPNERWAQPS
ncbi:enolase C-terminal domain-like protein [Microbacterium sp. ET2]|uniref:enolase C-terminal domain-like protein n=1 Tax=Microbacterium albipurpureum TaxID=3050384 RepID=UPI00259D2CAE|nr:enolase C-terminal domain-like protein [Microbacterium sp. ET2 (Ac-2212)]WJL96968.1 enolase C-terminal domain-like protein [Microbacterium sp. ET2 (Ac-2212)]